MHRIVIFTLIFIRSSQFHASYIKHGQVHRKQRNEKFDAENAYLFGVLETRLHKSILFNLSFQQLIDQVSFQTPTFKQYYITKHIELSIFTAVHKIFLQYMNCCAIIVLDRITDKNCFCVPSHRPRRRRDVCSTNRRLASSYAYVS